ncbi:MAG: acetylneuraminic acid synthetase [bacterium]|nr:acetylneuraminic acid synthetase [bacterium]
MKIDLKEVNRETPAYIIAEAGMNHEGDLKTALKMIDEAAKAGADAIKFQTYSPGKLTTQWAPKYWKDAHPDKTQYDFFLENKFFTRSDWENLVKRCKEKNITFLTTCFDKEGVDLFEELGMPAYKVASADITDYDLLGHIAKTGKPILLSTGASTLDEVEATVNYLQEQSSGPIAILHCVLSYPTPFEEANLNRIKELQKRFPEYLIGLSDHTVPDEAHLVPVLAAVFGAAIIEKHYTLDCSLQGNDHRLSVDPRLLKLMVENVHKAQRLAVAEHKEILDIEKDARTYARRSIVAANDIPGNTVITETHITYKRPGTGLPPYEKNKVIGKRTKNTIKQDQLILLDSLE